MKNLLVLVSFATVFALAAGEEVKWEKLEGKADAISARGYEIWKIENKAVFRIHGLDWARVTAASGDIKDPVSVGATIDGYTWIVNAQNQVFQWEKCQEFWQQMPGVLDQVNAYSRDLAIGVKSGNVHVWRNNSWTALPMNGLSATSAAIGQKSGQTEIWMIAFKPDGDPVPFSTSFRFDQNKNQWVWVSSIAFHVDTHGPGSVAVVGNYGGVHIYYGGGNWNRNWGDRKNAKAVAISYKRLFMLTNNNEVFTLKAPGWLKNEEAKEH